MKTSIFNKSIKCAANRSGRVIGEILGICDREIRDHKLLRKDKVKNGTSPENHSSRGNFKNVLIGAMALCFIAFGQKAMGQTRYYTQSKIVHDNGSEQKGDGRGQFITFNEKGCYDSDKNGYTVNNGFMNFGKKDKNREYYMGNSYWGEAMYIFTENYKRLNIRPTYTTTVYVYVLSTPPANTSTCALIRNDTPNIMPIIINSPPINLPNGSTQQGALRQTPSTYTETCGRCSGTGEIVASSVSYIGGLKWCNKCNTEVANSHYHTTCPSCSGLGKRTRTR